MSEEITCIDCGGEGKFLNFHKIDIPCFRCEGKKTHPAIQVEWKKRGDEHHQWRIKNRESLRNCAIRMGIDVTLLSSAELGLINPEGILPDIE